MRSDLYYFQCEATSMTAKKCEDIYKLFFNLHKNGFTKPEMIVEYAKKLRGMSFADVKNLGLAVDLPEKDYADKKRKGGLGNFLEEHYFGYTANSDSRPDFPEAGLELKVSPVERGKNRQKQEVLKAGERLVLSMIPNDGPLPDELTDSHLVDKVLDILLISYLRDRKAESNLDQIITMVNRMQISGEDLEIIKEDYRTIARMVQEGRAHELSEGMTNYLGACTKGATAEKSLRAQFYPLVREDGTQEYIPAKSRAFSLKQSFMTAMVQKFEAQQVEEDALLSSADQLKEKSFEEYVLELLRPYNGQTTEELHAGYGQGLSTRAKNYHAALVARLLGSKTGSLAEFDKANIKVKTIKLGEDGTLKEHLKLQEVDFMHLHSEQEWEESAWYELLTETRFLFTVFKEDSSGHATLRGAFFWSMPPQDIGGEEYGSGQSTAYSYWCHSKKLLREGVELTTRGNTVSNNFMNAADHSVSHLRPSAQKAAYRFTDGRPPKGKLSDSRLLPDGQRMTKQAFWINNKYLEPVARSKGF